MLNKPFDHPLPTRRRSLQPPVLRFAPLAWLKLQYLCHAGPTEVGGFGISSPHDPLYIEQVQTLMQGATAVSVEFSDSAVADHFDHFADQAVSPIRCGRIWIHTHPGSSAAPSCVDEETFSRVFGPCDWALMFILSRSGQTYGRLQYSAGPGGSVLVPVAVDWAAWPQEVQNQTRQNQTRQDQTFQEQFQQLKLWQHEYDANVFDVTPRLPGSRAASSVGAAEDGLENDAWPWDLEAEPWALGDVHSAGAEDDFYPLASQAEQEVSLDYRY